MDSLALSQPLLNKQFKKEIAKKLEAQNAATGIVDEKVAAVPKHATDCELHVLLCPMRHSRHSGLLSIAGAECLMPFCRGAEEQETRQKAQSRQGPRVCGRRLRAGGEQHMYCCPAAPASARDSTVPPVRYFICFKKAVRAVLHNHCVQVRLAVFYRSRRRLRKLARNSGLELTSK